MRVRGHCRRASYRIAHTLYYCGESQYPAGRDAVAASVISSEPRSFVDDVSQRHALGEPPAVVEQDVEPPVVEIGSNPAVCGVSNTFEADHNA